MAANERSGACAGIIRWLDPAQDINFRHYRLRHLAAELLRGYCNQVVLPGSQAPDFQLPTAAGELVRLSDLRGRPVVLHFVSYTCPLTRGGIHMMKELHAVFGRSVQFIEVLVRQAHPGERHSAYRTSAEKLADAWSYQQEEGTAWPVLIDDVEASAQSAYGGTAASIYLIDSMGRVAFCGVWGPSPLLRRAIEELLANGPPVQISMDRVPHLGAAIVYGRRGPASGGRRALMDLELGFPGATLLFALGGAARPVLGPIVLRTAPLPRTTRNALIVLSSLSVGLMVLEVGRLRKRTKR
jgi:hypothetical protein